MPIEEAAEAGKRVELAEKAAEEARGVAVESLQGSGTASEYTKAEVKGWLDEMTSGKELTGSPPDEFVKAAENFKSKIREKENEQKKQIENVSDGPVDGIRLQEPVTEESPITNSEIPEPAAESIMKGVKNMLEEKFDKVPTKEELQKFKDAQEEEVAKLEKKGSKLTPEEGGKLTKLRKGILAMTALIGALGTLAGEIYGGHVLYEALKKIADKTTGCYEYNVANPNKRTKKHQLECENKKKVAKDACNNACTGDIDGIGSLRSYCAVTQGHTCADGYQFEWNTTNVGDVLSNFVAGVTDSLVEGTETGFNIMIWLTKYWWSIPLLIILIIGIRVMMTMSGH